MLREPSLLFRRDWSRIARAITLALCVGLGLAIAIAEFGDWYLSDLGVYLGAADRVLAGESPYEIASSDIHFVYRYAPWFAYAFVPFTWMPLEVTRVVWSSLMVFASVWAVWPVLRSGPAGVALGTLCGGILIGVAGSGNIQPLLIAVLVHGIDRRSGPLWIGLAASLKVVPIVFAGYYLARREWWRLAFSIGVTAVLVAPMLLYERPSITFDPGESLSLWSASPFLWILIGLASGIAALAACWRRSPHAGAALAAAAMLALPRLFIYDLSFALPGTALLEDGDDLGETKAPA